MMRTKGRVSYKQFAAIAALVVGCMSTGLHAQDAGTYQLPPAPTPSATAQGPVVPDAPPPRLAPTPSASALPTPTPSASSEPVVLPTPRAATSPASPASSRQRGGNPGPVASPSPISSVPTPTPTVGPVPTPAAPVIAPTFDADIAAQPKSLPQPESEEASVHPVVWLALALALLTALVAALVLHRRRSEAAEPVFEPPVIVPPPQQDPVRPPLAPPPRPRAAAPALALDLDAARMSASLVNATLAYTITLAAKDAIEDVLLRGDMTSAHASRPDADHFTLEDAPVLHHVARIETGERIELRGEIRLPLAAITPIRHGTAAMFVPLVRIEATGMANGTPVRLRVAFVVGLDEQGSERLQPFRLDLGPRVYQKIGQRALTVPAFA